MEETFALDERRFMEGVTSSSGASTPRFEPLILPIKATFAVQGKLYAIRTAGEQFEPSNQTRMPKLFLAAFNGRDYRNIIDNTILPIGEIRVGGQRETNVEIVPLLLAHAPSESLNKFRYDLDTITLLDEHSYDDGVACIQLSVSSPSSEARVGLVYVDPRRQFVPLRLLRENHGVITSDTHIHYIRDDRIGWRVKDWRMGVFTDSGELIRQWSGRVTSASINEPIAKDVFDVTFPAGTHFIRYDGDDEAYYMQEVNGIRALKDGEFGVLTLAPTRFHFLTRTSVLIGVIAVLVIFAAAVAIGRFLQRKEV